MYIHTRSLYPKAPFAVPRRIQMAMLLVAFLVPIKSLSVEKFPTTPFTQEFYVTAYYSPKPDQCCYVRGGLEADKILNGEGLITADGTKVYPGIVAAPRTYPFGTRVLLPGIGTMTVHDRGGAIRELGSGVHRIDVWVGEGEEGLARALALGGVRITGTVYPVQSNQPRESFALDDLPAPKERLKKFLVAGTDLTAVKPKIGDRNLSAAMLQERLRSLGYFRHAVTGFFGQVTRQSLAAFQRDYVLHASPDQLSVDTAAYILAADVRKDARLPLSSIVDSDSSETAVAEAQRLLRFLGYYRGRTDGIYDDEVFTAILKFQQENFLVGTVNDPGAGRIGPLTRRRIQSRWNQQLVLDLAEDRFLAIRQIDEIFKRRGQALQQYMGEGDSGSQIRLLQRLLAVHGFFPSDKINGNFGPLTAQSVFTYQLSRNIVERGDDTGAGHVGPETMRQLRDEQRREAYAKVRGAGWRAL